MLVSVIPGASMSNSTLTIPLPKSWPAKVRSAMLQVVSLAKYAAVYTRSWAADCPKARVRFRVGRDRYQEDNALLREELRIKDARMAHPNILRSSFNLIDPSLAALPWRCDLGYSSLSGSPRRIVPPRTTAA